MTDTTLATVAVFVTDLVVRLGLSLRIIRRRGEIGASLAWLAVVLSTPVLGAVIYLLVGELRTGRRRRVLARAYEEPHERWLALISERYPPGAVLVPDPCGRLERLTRSASGLPAFGGNDLALLPDAREALAALVEDIDAAQNWCDLEFYIWEDGGLADRVAEALERAARRGVECRVLVDAVGSRAFLRGSVAARMRASGVRVAAALPVGIWRVFFARLDLRNHRKVAVIDGAIAYAGSMNLVDPTTFKADAGVGQWVDAMARIRGPVVEALAEMLLRDWELETGESLDAAFTSGHVRSLGVEGGAIVQPVPSGPGAANRAIRDVLLTAIYSARESIVITTPYFVPDESLLIALTSALGRGVDVTIVQPERIDSVLVRLACRPAIEELLRAGAEVRLFTGGLLHTKSITVDEEFGFFGSLNLDLRSLTLNFELTLAVYDARFTDELVALQREYLAASRAPNRELGVERSWAERVCEDAARLLSPLL